MLGKLIGQTAIAVAGIVLVGGVAYLGYVYLKHLRGAISKDDISVADLTQNFEEMRREGDISEAEFRTIKAVIGKSQDSTPNGT